MTRKMDAASLLVAVRRAGSNGLPIGSLPLGKAKKHTYLKGLREADLIRVERRCGVMVAIAGPPNGADENALVAALNEKGKVAAASATKKRTRSRVKATPPEPEFVDLPDRGYRPKQVDPILKGAGRATGATAKAVKRGTTLTRSEFLEDES